MKTTLPISRSLAVLAMCTTFLFTPQLSYTQTQKKFGIGFETARAVTASLLSNDTLFLAGNFIRIGYNAGGIVQYKGNQRVELDEGMPYLPTSTIFAAEQDSAGGWYLGGNNFIINGTNYGPVIHVLSNGAINANFKVDTQGGIVHAMKLHNGVLYVAGAFTIMNSVPRFGLAAINAITGFTDASFNAGLTSTQYGEMTDISIHGDTLYLAGYMTPPGSSPTGLASFNRMTGELKRSFLVNGVVRKIKTEADTLWVAGDYSSILGSTQTNLSKINLRENKPVPGFGIQVNSRLSSFDITNDSIIYIGGFFTQVNGTNRQGVAMLHKKNGAIIPGFQSNITGQFGMSVSRIAIVGNKLMVAGNFTSSHGLHRNNLVEIDRFTGATSNWNTSILGSVEGFKVKDNNLVIYGLMNLIGYENRDGFAAIKLPENRILPLKYTFKLNQWSVGSVNAMVKYGNTLFAGGYFNLVNSQEAQNLAAIHLPTGVVSAPMTSINDAVEAMDLAGNKLYLAGRFTSVNEQSRNKTAALDLPSLTLSNWNATQVFTTGYRLIKAHNNKIFLAGSISTLRANNTTQYGMIAVDPNTGAYDPSFDFKIIGDISGAVFYNNKIYVAGNFREFSPLKLTGFAAVNPDGSLWDSFIPEVGTYNPMSVIVGQTIFLVEDQLLVAKDLGNGDQKILYWLDPLTGSKISDAGRLNRLTSFNPLPGLRNVWYQDSTLILTGAFDLLAGIQSPAIGFFDLRITPPKHLFTQMYPNRYAPVPGGEFFLYGRGFEPGAIIKFSKTGQVDFLVPESDIEYIDSWTMKIKANLAGWQPGVYEVTMTIGEESPMKLSGGFTIEEEKPFKIEMFLSGTPFLGRNDYPFYHIYYRNTGNITAKGVPMYYSVSDNGKLYFTGPLTGVDYMNLNQAYDTTLIPQGIIKPYHIVTAANGKDYKIYPLLLPEVKGYQSGKLTALGNSPTLGKIDFAAFTTRPWVIKDVVNPQVSNSIWKGVLNAGGSGVSKGKVSGGIKNNADNTASSNGGVSVPGGGGSGGSGGGGGGGLAPARVNVNNMDLTIVWQVRETATESGVNIPESSYPGIIGDIMDDFLPPVDWDPFCADCFPEDPEEEEEPVYEYYFPEDSISAPNKPTDQSAIAGEVLASMDPNAKYGPAGINGSSYLNQVKPFPYIVLFENVDTATAPARLVRIVDTLDINVFDLSTFELGDISFGKYSIFIPPGLKTYQNRIDLNPDYNKWVDVKASLNENTGIFELLLVSVDPATGEYPVNPLDGFLLPNNSEKEGEGSVGFHIELKPDLPDGVSIDNYATIYFDDNDPIITNTWTNIFDRVPPQSAITGIQKNGEEYTLEGIGSDEGSGIYSYAVYMQLNGGIWKELDKNRPNLNAKVSLVQDSAYAFTSLSIDSAGNLEIWPSTPDFTYTPIGIENRQVSFLKVFPNPATDYLRIVSEYKNPVKILELYDSTGKKLMTREVNADEYTMNVSNLKAGIYTVVVSYTDGQKTSLGVQKR